MSLAESLGIHYIGKKIKAYKRNNTIVRAKEIRENLQTDQNPTIMAIEYPSKDILSMKVSTQDGEIFSSNIQNGKFGVIDDIESPILIQHEICHALSAEFLSSRLGNKLISDLQEQNQTQLTSDAGEILAVSIQKYFDNNFDGFFIRSYSNRENFVRYNAIVFAYIFIVNEMLDQNVSNVQKNVFKQYLKNKSLQLEKQLFHGTKCDHNKNLTIRLPNIPWISKIKKLDSFDFSTNRLKKFCRSSFANLPIELSYLEKCLLENNIVKIINSVLFELKD